MTMLPFAYYLLKVIICSAVLFGYYWFFLRNKVFHAYNRFYLLAIVAISILLPLFKINFFHSNDNKTAVIKMLQVVKASDEYMDEIIIGAPNKTSVNLVDVLPFVYVLISSVLLIMLIQMLVSIVALMKSHEKISIENIQFINTDAARGTPFSFFKYIFWNKQIDINSHNGNRIFKHEIAHVQERHSWDKMFINLVLIVFWSNPIFWWVRRELSMIHEFIADKKAIEDGDTTAFAAMILEATYPQKNFYITNNFFYSPIKRRLMMLTKNQHPRMNYISRLLVLPVLIIVFGAFTIKIANNINKENITQKLDKKIIVVIDAGHGGQDAGAINKDGIAEKDLALQLVKKIKSLNNDENIQIILTRDDDIFSDVKQKAAFAKAQNPDLFISVHLQSTPKKEWNTVSGMEIYVAKEGIKNEEKSKILGTAIINSFKNNYSLPVPTLIVQKQKGVYVLQANSFPSVLIEAGHLTNDKDLAYLQSIKGQEAFARNVLDAIRSYSELNSVYNFKNEKAKIDSPPAIKIEVSQVENYRKNEKLLKNPRMTDMTLDLDNSKNILGRGGMIVINNTLYDLQKLQNKVIRGRQSIVYKKGDTETIKKYGANAANGIIIVEDATIEEMSSNEKINGYKNSLKFSTDSIIFFDESGSKVNFGLTDKTIKSSSPSKSADLKNRISLPQNENYLYVINGKISDKKGIDLISPESIININVLKGNSAILLYGEKGKDGVIEITTKDKKEKESEHKTKSIQTPSDKVFTQVEVEPQFPDGPPAWGKYLQKNINGKIPSDEGFNAGTYSFIIKFIVAQDGTLSDFSTETYPNSKTAKHCIDIIKNGPKWIPAKQNGHIVAAYRKQPITFVIDEEMDEKEKVISQIKQSILNKSSRGAFSLEK